MSAALQARDLPSFDPDEVDEAPGEEAEAAEEEILDEATAALDLDQLRAEIDHLKVLEDQAFRLKQSGQDTKWRELLSILDDPIIRDPVSGLRRKIIIFTEPRDTLEYLQQKIAATVGADGVVVIHGGVAREARRAAIAAFNSDPVVRVMIANDAAGEGVNLQRGAHLMVNYDLPWNPNRIEQRFGRIHRIGQTEVCHLWNLCANNTREGEVYRRLLEKLEEARKALGGKVYDVLGELFEGQALRDLLVEAIRYGDRPEKKAELFRKVDGAVDVAAIEKLVAERKLTSEGMDPNSVSEIREQMERAQARRLQPHFIGAFFREAFSLLGGRIAERESGRFEITRVPGVLKHRDRLIGRGDPGAGPLRPRHVREDVGLRSAAGGTAGAGAPAAGCRRRRDPGTLPAVARARQRAGGRGGRRDRAATADLPRTCDPRRARGEVRRSARRLAAAAIHPVEGGRLGRRRGPCPLSRLSADQAGGEGGGRARIALRLGLRVRSSSARWAMRSPMLCRSTWPR